MCFCLVGFFCFLIFALEISHKKHYVAASDRKWTGIPEALLIDGGFRRTEHDALHCSRKG